jgi:NADH:ubiquinone oxidoreductase subunit B-like Fe-S oxidoreductase
MITIKSCPPRPEAILNAFHQVGIDINPAVLEHMDQAPGFYLRKYEGKPEFDDSLFRVE